MSIPDEFSTYCRLPSCGMYNVDGYCQEHLADFINFIIKKKRSKILNRLATYRRIKRSEATVLTRRRWKERFSVIQESEMETLWNEYEKGMENQDKP